MNLVVATVVRNEADRYLRSALECWSDFADTIVVLDDNSTDGTREVCWEAGPEVQVRGRSHFAKPMWGDESTARAELYNAVLRCYPDWVMWLDADMVPSRNPRPFMEGCEGLAFRLYDLWEPRRYRCDSYWQAHAKHHPWAVNAECLPLKARYLDRGLHCGHLPLNTSVESYRGLNEEHCVLLHYGYMDAQDREDKAVAYLEQPDLHPVERAHALSITRKPELKMLPVEPEYELRRG